MIDLTGKTFGRLTVLRFSHTIGYCIFGGIFAEYRYQQGQIDALTGHATVRLVTHSDSTKTWEKK